MKPADLRVGIEKGVEAIDVASDHLAALQRTREELNTHIDDAQRRLHDTRSSATAIGLLDGLTDVPQAEIALLKMLLATGTSSHVGENNLERLASLNETLEALRGLYSSGPCLVLSNYLNPSYPDRQKGIVLVTNGTYEPTVVENETGFHFDDQNGFLRPIYARVGGHMRLSSDFEELHKARVTPNANVQVYKGADAIRQAVAELKESDITAFFVVVMKTQALVEYDEALLALPEEQKAAILEALVRNIAVSSISSAESGADDKFRVKELLGEHKIDPAHEPYLQLARYYVEHPDFYEHMGRLFGEEFEHGAVLSNAYTMQCELLSGRGNIVTPLGTISLSSEMASWPNGLRFPSVPLPTSRQDGIS